MTSKKQNPVVERARAARERTGHWPGSHAEALCNEVVRLHAEVLKLESHIVDVYNAQEAAAQVETAGKPARDADHCDFPDCEQHYSAVVANIGVVTNRPLPPDRQGCVDFLVEIARIVKAAQSPVKSEAEPVAESTPCPRCSAFVKAHGGPSQVFHSDGPCPPYFSEKTP